MTKAVKLYDRYARKAETAGAFVFFLLLMMKFSLFNTYAALPSSVGTVLSLLMCLPLAFVLMLREYDVRELAVTLGLLGLGAVSYIASGDMGMFLSLAAIIVLRSVPVEKLLGWFIIVRAVPLTVLYFLYSFDVISSPVVTINKTPVLSVTAYTFGHAHPNQLAMTFAAFVFAFLCIADRSDRRRWGAKLLMLLLATSFVYAVTRSRTMLIAVLLALAAAFLLEYRWCDRIIGRLAGNLGIAAIALLALCGLVCPFLYGNDNIGGELAGMISRLSNRRIEFSAIIADSLPVTPFGNDTPFSLITERPIDCSYTVIFYRFGALCTVVYLAIYAYACRFFAKNGKTFYAVCILVTLLYAFFESMLCWPMVNVAIFLCSGAFVPAHDRPGTFTVCTLLGGKKK